MTPSSQKDRPISFLLMDPDGIVAEQDLVIRPEELTRQEPSRNNVQQTLGGAWLDSFGQGVASITLSGHTGWRGTSTEDGTALFQKLRETVFTEWHTRRAERVRQLLDPNDVQLVLADQLNDVAVVVAPQQFQLRRHRTRPLLSQFQISLVELGDFSDQQAFQLSDQITEAIDHPGREQLALESLRQNVAVRTGLLADLKDSGLTADLVEASEGLLDLSNSLLEKAEELSAGLVGGLDAIAAPLLSISTAVSQASANLFSILAMPSNIAAHAKHLLMRIAGNFLDAFCNLRNGFKRLFQFPDFTDLFGASACSSTGGGRPHSPWAQENPFLKVFPDTSPIVSITESARESLESLMSMDSVIEEVQQSEIIYHMKSMSSGVVMA